MLRHHIAMAFLLVGTASAQASLLNSQVTGSLLTPTGTQGFSALPATVGDPAVEFVAGDVLASIEADFGADSLTIRLITGSNFSNSFFDYDFAFDILSPGLVTGVSVDSGGTVLIDPSGAPLLVGDRLTFSTLGTSFTPPNTTLSVTLRFSTAEPPVPVPTPGTLSLVGAGVLGLGLARSRRRT